jgi:hypothetical protein
MDKYYYLKDYSNDTIKDVLITHSDASSYNDYQRNIDQAIDKMKKLNLRVNKETNTVYVQNDWVCRNSRIEDREVIQDEIEAIVWYFRPQIYNESFKLKHAL